AEGNGGSGPLVGLADGHLACYWCGVSVETPADRDRVIFVDPQSQEGVPVLQMPQHFPPVPLGRCELHQGLADRATGIVDRLPVLRSRLGSPAVWRIECALVGLELVGVADPLAGEDLRPADVVRVIDALAVPAAQLRFALLLAPVLAIRTGQAAREPWAHRVLRPGFGQAHGRLRSAYAAMLAFQVAADLGPVRVAVPRLPELADAADHGLVPVAGGCVWCGTDHVVIEAGRKPWIMGPAPRVVYVPGLGESAEQLAARLAARQQTAKAAAKQAEIEAYNAERERDGFRVNWEQILAGRPQPRTAAVDDRFAVPDRSQATRPTWRWRSMEPSQLGLLGVSGRVAGWMCQACDEVVQPELDGPAVLGRPQIEKALTVWAGTAGQLDVNWGWLDGLRPWAALVVRAQLRGWALPDPNRARWQHVGSREEVVEALKQEPRIVGALGQVKVGTA
ncbi:MAG: hypothetical protein J2P23_04305, partial [Microlunatus sp.]|nr:hypothetical protein [Microlunatus sp.]